jgi:NADH-quinone oxidoreductase subunit H
VADALKVLLKEVVYVKNVELVQIVLLPSIYLAVSSACLLVFEWGNNTTNLQLEYSIPATLLVLGVSNLIAVMTGLSLNNKYTRIAATRAVNMAALNEINLGVLLITIVFAYGSFNFSDMLAFKKGLYGYTPVLLALAPVVSTALMDIGKAPFDLVEAETEIIMGFHSDYSGFLFVLFLLGEYLHMVIFAYIGAAIM